MTDDTWTAATRLLAKLPVSPDKVRGGELAELRRGLQSAREASWEPDRRRTELREELARLREVVEVARPGCDLVELAAARAGLEIYERAVQDAEVAAARAAEHVRHMDIQFANARDAYVKARAHLTRVRRDELRTDEHVLEELRRLSGEYEP